MDERRPAITPQLAWRVAVLGGIAFALFGIVFFRLWFLQVLTGQDYVSEAAQNRVRTVSIAAPRGDIVDRNGAQLVKTRVGAVVQVDPNRLPQPVLDLADQYRRRLAAAQAVLDRAESRYDAFVRRLREDGRRTTRAESRERRRLRRATRAAPRVSIPPLGNASPQTSRLYARLGRVLRMKPSTIHERVTAAIADQAFSNARIKTDVSSAAYTYLLERQEDFPGVIVDQQYLRSYPHDQLAAQLFGTLGQISPDELKRKANRGVAPGTQIGQSGLEAEYDAYLRGKPGYTKVPVNALGNRDDARRARRVSPQQGESVKLTLDLGLQRAANDALERAIGQAGGGAKAGAYVAMDPRDGSVLALGSVPSFDANEFAKPISQSRYNRLVSDAAGKPLLDRAIGSLYPTGSTFKPVTAIAALEAGLITPRTPIDDNGVFKLGPQTFKNAKDEKFGRINLVDALTVSSDVFFYNLGKDANSRGAIIQRWAKRLGFGRRTGIDLPSEEAGLVPDAKWRDAGFARYTKCIDRYHLALDSTPALFRCGGISKGWTTGDNVNFAVGQGDFQATPLQLAVAYSAFANDGRVVRPHLGQAILDGQGRTVEELRWSARRRVKMDPTYRAAIMEGLRDATSKDGGTSVDVFKGFPYPVYGKTGTAERGAGNQDQSWFAAYVPSRSRPIVVVTTIEKGGFGAATAAPAARLILSEWFHLGDDKFYAGSDQSQ